MNQKVDGERMKKGYKEKRFAIGVIYHIFTFCFACVMIYPLVWMVLSSFKDVVFRYELMQKELGTAEDAVVDDSIIDTLRQVYVRKLRDSGFEGRVSCVFANERGWF